VQDFVVFVVRRLHQAFLFPVSEMDIRMGDEGQSFFPAFDDPPGLPVVLVLAAGGADGQGPAQIVELGPALKALVSRSELIHGNSFSSGLHGGRFLMIDSTREATGPTSCVVLSWRKVSDD